MGIFDRKDKEAREEALRARDAELDEKRREEEANTDPALIYFLELVVEEIRSAYASGADHYTLSYASSEPIPTKVRQRFGHGVFGIKHEVVERVLREREGLVCTRSPIPGGGYWIRFPAD